MLICEATCFLLRALEVFSLDFAIQVSVECVQALLNAGFFEQVFYPFRTCMAKSKAQCFILRCVEIHRSREAIESGVHEFAPAEGGG